MPIPGVSIVSPTMALGAADLVDRKCVNLTDLFPLASLLPIVPQFSQFLGRSAGERALCGGVLLQLGGGFAAFCVRSRKQLMGKSDFSAFCLLPEDTFSLCFPAFVCVPAFKLAFPGDGVTAWRCRPSVVRAFTLEALLRGGRAALHGSSFMNSLCFINA